MTPPVGPYPQPPPVAASASFAVTGVEHTIASGGLIGMRFTGTLDVPDKVTGQVQIVVDVVALSGGADKPILSLMPAFGTSDGQVASGSEPITLQGNPVHTTWSAFLPYSALSIEHNLRVYLSAIPPPLHQPLRHTRGPSDPVLHPDGRSGRPVLLQQQRQAGRSAEPDRDRRHHRRWGDHRRHAGLEGGHSQLGRRQGRAGARGASARPADHAVQRSGEAAPRNLGDRRDGTGRL